MFDKREQELINALKDLDNGAGTMRVVGRGTLVMSAKAVRDSQKYQELMKKANMIIGKKLLSA